MSEQELEYEHSNKSTLEKCCKIMSAATVAVKMKTRKVDTRRNIEAIKDKRALRESIELSL